jgi:hypothetical protein
MFILKLVIIAAISLLPGAFSPGQAQETTRFSFLAAPVFHAETGLDRGGKFSLGHYQIRGSASRPLSESLQAGISIGYDYLDFDFSGVSGFAGHTAWGSVHRIGLSLPVFFRSTENWQLFISPSIDFSGEQDSELSKATRYGAAATAAYRFSPDFTLGAGIGIFQGLEETSVFPFLTVYWKIGENWLLTNPLSAGPIGPAGLELTYSPSELWELGGGGAFRSTRFRLDDKGIAPDGVGQLSGLPLWLRLTRKFSRQYKLDLYGGVLLNGELRIEDRDGRKLDSDDFDPAAFMALNISANF